MCQGDVGVRANRLHASHVSCINKYPINKRPTLDMGMIEAWP
jgi:hypothetical protein